MIQRNIVNKKEAVFASVAQMGHFKPLIPFIKEFQNRGHTATVFVANDPKYKNELEKEGVKDVNVIEVDMSGDISEMKEKGNIISSGGPLALFSAELYPSIKSYYDERNPPDVIVYDFFATAVGDVADVMKIPAVTVNPCPLSFSASNPGSNKSLGSNMKTFFLGNVLGAVVFKFLRVLRNKERKKRNLPKLKVQDVLPSPKQERHTISTTADGFEFVKDRSPLLQLVGPSAPLSPAPLGEELSQWLEEQEKPIVYVAFGTLHVFDEKSLKNLSKELLSLSENISVLWSLPADQQSMLGDDKLPTNWRIETFVPQWSVLSHPNVKLFVSHCGSNSTYESILNEVPVVACPCGKDQFANAARIEAAGVGVEVKNGPSGDIAGTIQSMQRNLSAYEEAVKKAKENFKKQGGAKRAVDIIEMIAEKGYEEVGEVTPLKN